MRKKQPKMMSNKSDRGVEVQSLYCRAKILYVRELQMEDANMKETQQEQTYQFDEFDNHVNLWNLVSPGSGKCLDMLRHIEEGIHAANFYKSPTILIAGEECETFAMAMTNSLCVDDVRNCDGKYFNIIKNQMDFFDNSMDNTVHIMSNVEKMGMSESVLWDFIKKREHCFTIPLSGSFKKYIFLNGVLILTAKDIKRVSDTIKAEVNFVVVLEPYTREQLAMILKQRLQFCGINYGQNDEVLKAITEFGTGDHSIVIRFLRSCILVAETEGKDCLTLELVKKTAGMHSFF